ncbi:unnamed protein product [Brassica rapa subsp. trilocularis]
MDSSYRSRTDRSRSLRCNPRAKGGHVSLGIFFC